VCKLALPGLENLGGSISDPPTPSPPIIWQ
jgi:hypothetical protein